MSAVSYDITLEENADFNLKLTYRDEDCGAIVVTGYGAQLEIKNGFDGTALVTASVSNGLITLSGASGIFNVNIPVASVDAIKLLIDTRTARYDLFAWPGASTPTVDPFKLLKGRARYDLAVTDP